jgi:uncharacterized membrane protein (UPF0127 family)
MKKLIVVFVSLALLASFYIWRTHTGWLSLKQDRQLIKLSLRESFLAPEKKELLVELVKTPASARQGLSDRPTLRSHNDQAIDGMLFVFESAQPLSFWMKDMQFAIDICWLRQGRFLDCARSAPAPAEGEAPASFASPGLADMVLETLPDFFSQDDLALKLFFK